MLARSLLLADEVHDPLACIAESDSEVDIAAGDEAHNENGAAQTLKGTGGQEQPVPAAAQRDEWMHEANARPLFTADAPGKDEGTNEEKQAARAERMKVCAEMTLSCHHLRAHACTLLDAHSPDCLGSKGCWWTSDSSSYAALFCCKCIAGFIHVDHITGKTDQATTKLWRCKHNHRRNTLVVNKVPWARHAQAPVHTISLVSPLCTEYDAVGKAVYPSCSEYDADWRASGHHLKRMPMAMLMPWMYQSPCWASQIFVPTVAGHC